MKYAIILIVLGIVYFFLFNNLQVPAQKRLPLRACLVPKYQAVIENVFLWPGLGQMLINGLLQRDFSIVLTMQMFYVVLSLAGNVIMDIAYTVVDPRVRLEN